jgi:prepilin peptidase CpaA
VSSIHIFLFASVAAAAIASVYDVRSGRIPNWLSLGALLVAPVAHFIHGAVAHGLAGGLSALGWSLAGAATCALIPLVCWFAGTFGGGDVKLLAAVGALCLPRLGMTIEFYATLIGALFGLGRLAWSGSLLGTLRRSLAMLVNPLLPKARRRTFPPEAMTPLRFAPAILGATLLCSFPLPY